MQLTQDILQYIEEHADEAYELLITLAQIPAPSNHEEKRAAFVRDWLIAQGAQGVCVDAALNVIYPIACEGDGPITVYMAHSDVVFPDEEALPLRVEDGRIYCPGVGDDTANAVALLTVAKYLAQTGAQSTDGGVLLVINSGEEGLGNLKGCRAIMDRYGSRVREFVTFDGYAKSIAHRAVGSRRYRVGIDTEGGHSWGKFGNRNAIAYMASLIDTLYTVKVPQGGRTTYNVGTVSGGTSVNTIAQHAEMLYEFRSDTPAHLDTMERHFNAAIEFYRTKGIDVTVTLLGERPCGIEIDETAHNALIARASDAILRHYGLQTTLGAGSTDCNIPLSRGIPAVCVGAVCGGGAHTREEYVEINSLKPGIAVAFEMILHHFGR